MDYKHLQKLFEDIDILYNTATQVVSFNLLSPINTTHHDGFFYVHPGLMLDMLIEKYQNSSGVESGESIRFKGLGDNSITQLPRGDLIIVVKVKNHNIFLRDGRHLKFTHLINIFDLILGTKIELNVLSGSKISVFIPAGTQPGTVMSVSGHGLPCYKTGTTGNLYVTVKGVVPKIEDQDLLERIQELNDAINKVS